MCKSSGHIAGTPGLLTHTHTHPFRLIEVMRGLLLGVNTTCIVKFTMAMPTMAQAAGSTHQQNVWPHPGVNEWGLLYSSPLPAEGHRAQTLWPATDTMAARLIQFTGRSLPDFACQQLAHAAQSVLRIHAAPLLLSPNLSEGSQLALSLSLASECFCTNLDQPEGR